MKKKPALNVNETSVFPQNCKLLAYCCVSHVSRRARRKIFVTARTVTQPLQTVPNRNAGFISWRIDAPLIFALLAGFLLLAKGTISSGPYDYDESDYMYAISR